jgi:hypothetical protein
MFERQTEVLKGMGFKEFFRQPEIRKITDRVEAEALEQRKALVAKLAATRDETRAFALAKKVAEAQAAVAKTKAAHEAAREAHNAAIAAYTSESLRSGNEAMRLEAELASTADKRIGQYRGALEELFQAMRLVGFASQPQAGEEKHERTWDELNDRERVIAQINGYIPAHVVVHEARVPGLLATGTELIQWARAEVNLVAIEALDSGQVRKRLEGINSKLAETMTALGIRLPEVGDDAVEPPNNRTL